MGILDSVLGGLLGGQTASSPVQSILGSMLGGGGQQSPGLGGLLQRFQQAGLGSVAQSWVGNGQNQPIAPNQLQQVFGDQQVNQWAQQSGMQPHDLLSQLSSFLPHAVDQMTPNGSIPAGGAPGSGNPFDEGGVELGGGNRGVNV